MPSWVPWVGKQTPAPAEPRDRGGPRRRSRPVQPAQPGERPHAAVRGATTTVTDRVIAVVNNDAITLGELQESIGGCRRPRTRQRA